MPVIRQDNWRSDMIKKILSVFFIVIGIAAAVTAVNMGLSNKDADPVLLAPPEAATQQVTGLMPDTSSN